VRSHLPSFHICSGCGNFATALLAADVVEGMALEHRRCPFLALQLALKDDDFNAGVEVQIAATRQPPRVFRHSRFCRLLTAILAWSPAQRDDGRACPSEDSDMREHSQGDRSRAERDPGDSANLYMQMDATTIRVAIA
jgi:hypothetical protein